MRYYDNPKGMIPTWLINWGAKVCTFLYLTEWMDSSLTISRNLQVYMYLFVDVIFVSIFMNILKHYYVDHNVN